MQQEESLPAQRDLETAAATAQEPTERRVAIERLVQLAAVGPLAAMLFDPRRAEAYGDGGFD